jgi:hypothetical protein
MNNKQTILIIMLVAIFGIAAGSLEKAEASVNASRPSAHFAKPLAMTPVEVKQDNRAEILRLYLEQYNSPLAEHAETLVHEADLYNLDWKWVAAIAGNESYFGQMIPPYSYNGWGFGVYGNNVRRFASWDEGIHVVSEALREDYMDRNGLQTIDQIGGRYAADPRWASKVHHWMDEMTQFEEDYNSKPTLSISL